jgi:hypothetical protein
MVELRKADQLALVDMIKTHTSYKVSSSTLRPISTVHVPSCVSTMQNIKLIDMLGYKAELSSGEYTPHISHVTGCHTYMQIDTERGKENK